MLDARPYRVSAVSQRVVDAIQNHDYKSFHRTCARSSASRCIFISGKQVNDHGAILTMKTQYYAASSLDGFIAAPGNSLDWLLQFGDVGGTSYPAFIREVGAIAMGSNTYEWILHHQGHVDSAKLQPWSYEQPAWVFTSRSLSGVRSADIRFVRGDVRPVHREMTAAAGDKNIWIVGGGELAGQFYDHGLLDELIIQVTSVTLKSGSPLLPRVITTPPLRLISATPYGESFAELRYEVPPRQGDNNPGSGAS
jgi:dihydrofolate reductase